MNNIKNKNTNKKILKNRKIFEFFTIGLFKRSKNKLFLYNFLMKFFLINFNPKVIELLRKLY